MNPKKNMKMNFVIIWISFCAIFLSASGQVTIQIESSDLEDFKEMFTNYLHRHHHVSQSNGIAIFFSKGAIQSASIMLTLVGANLITAKLEPYVSTKGEFLHHKLHQSHFALHIQ